MLAAAALVLVACNGDDDTTPTTPTTPPSATPDSAVVTSTSETSPTTDAVVPTTAPDTSTTTDSTPPPSTSDPAPTSIETIPLTVPSTTEVPLDDLTAEEREVVEFVLESFRLFNELRLDPTNDDKYDAALALRTGASLDASRGLIDEYRENGLMGTPFPNLPSTITPFLDTITIAEDGSSASVDVCWLNSNILVEVGGNPDGTDRVLNDIISAEYERYTLTRVGGAWLIASIAGGEVFEGSLTCD
ncbi:hypothetical protein [Ilumatobacter sp.]|uniref:hypothetical protein n=1 Tax=Ilumatobacter sp. TaxID=1967498 RepID=UPI0026105EBC|nr:hypothetical protein [Ilumatobacter sp.]